MIWCYTITIMINTMLYDNTNDTTTNDDNNNNDNDNNDTCY